MNNKTRLKAEVIAFVGLAFFMAYFTAERIGNLEPATLQSLSSGRDDWNRYARHAMEVCQNGLLMPQIACPYEGPGGFLYNYFLSLFILAGVSNVAWIYTVQVMVLFGTAVLLYLTWSPLSTNTGYRFLLFFLLPVGVVADMLPHYAFRLMSENLALPLVALFLYSSERFYSGEKPLNIGFLIISGLSLGMLALTRPQIIPFVPFWGVMTLYFIIKKFNVNSVFGPTLFFGLIVPCSLCVFVGIRNLVLCDEFSLLPLEGMKYALEMNSVKSAFSLSKILFVLGWLKSLEPQYTVRPHWLLSWLLFLILLFWRFFIYKKGLCFNENYWMNLSLLVYYSITLFFVELTSYGYRYVIPVIPLLWGIMTPFIITKNYTLKA